MTERHDLARSLVIASGAVALLVTGLVFAFAWSRHLHVDELNNVMNAQAIVRFARADAALPLDLPELLSGALTSSIASSADVCFVLRGVFAVAFLTMLATVACAQPFLTGTGGRLVAFAFVALWWPAWRAGYEIRHDIVVGVATTVITAVATRPHRGGVSWRAAFVLAGAAVAAQLSSHKAFAMVVPLLALTCVNVVAAPGASLRDVARGTARSVLRLLVALIVAVTAGLGIFAAAGVLSAYVDDVRAFLSYATAQRASSASALFAFMLQAGTVHFLLACASPIVALAAWRKGIAAAWPAAIAAAGAYGALAVIALSPAPFPYNLAWMSAPVLVAALATLSTLLAMPRPWPHVAVGALAIAVLQFAAGALNDEHAHATWDDQLDTMTIVETLTGPDDPVLDGLGLVATRPPPSRDWLLHYLMIEPYARGERESFPAIVHRTAPPVLIHGQYRLSYLPKADLEAVQQRYAPISEHIAVLALAAVDGVTEVVRPGRYIVDAPTAVVVDGREHANDAVVSLERGSHTFEGPPAARLLWIGPTLSSLPRPKPFKTLTFSPNL